MTYKQQKYISPNSGYWKEKIRVLADTVSGEDQLSGSQRAICPLYPHMAEVVSELLDPLLKGH